MTLNEILKDEDNWCKFASAKDLEGNFVCSDSEHAATWSVDGAIRKICGEGTYPEHLTVPIIRRINMFENEDFEASLGIFEGRIDHVTIIACWNDLATTTWERVKEVIKRL